MKQSLCQQNIEQKLDQWAAENHLIQQGLRQFGYPLYQAVERGVSSLARVIVGQQLHTKVADGIWQKLVCSIGDITADRLLSVDEASLRQCGLSPSKIAYLKDLAMRSVSGLDLFALPERDDDAVDLLMSVHGIGRWTAENYLIFAEGRLDIWPAADLGIRIATGYLYQLSHRLDMKETRGLGDIFRPYRSIMALFLWHQYRNKNFC